MIFSRSSNIDFVSSLDSCPAADAEPAHEEEDDDDLMIGMRFESTNNAKAHTQQCNHQNIDVDVTRNRKFWLR